MCILEVEPHEHACEEAADDDEHHHGDVEPQVDHLERHLDDGSILRNLPVLPDDLVRHLAVLGRDPSQVVRPLVIEGHHLILASLQLLQLRPGDPVSRVFVEGHSPRDTFELELTELVEYQLGNITVFVVVILQALAAGFQFGNSLIQGWKTE